MRRGQRQITEAMIDRRVDAIIVAPIVRKAMVGVAEFRAQMPLIPNSLQPHQCIREANVAKH